MFSFLKTILKVVTNHKAPEYKTIGASCFDISIYMSKTLQPKELFNFPTDLRVEIPTGYSLLVFARSSLGQDLCIIPNSVGVIDSDYRGEIKVPILNLSDSPIQFVRGQRVAQGMLVKIEVPKIQQVDFLSPTKRGMGGFGSTGR